MKMPTPLMLDLYYQCRADELIQYGSLPVRDALMEMTASAERHTPRSGQLIHGEQNIDRIRSLAGRIFNQKRYLNVLLKDVRRPKPQSKSTGRYCRYKDKQFWKLGGAAEWKILAPQFNSLEQDARLTLGHLFEVLEEMSDFGCGMKWSGHAGVWCIAEYSILDRIITTRTIVEPGFRIMRDHGVAAHPEKSWTPATLKAEEESRNLNRHVARLLGAADFSSPCGIGNGLEGLSIAIRTELLSSLTLGEVGYTHTSSVQGQGNEQAISNLYELLTLLQFKKHLARATSSLDSYFSELSMLNFQIDSRATRKRISKNLQSTQALMKVLPKHLSYVMNITDSTRAAMTSSSESPTERGEQIFEQIKRYEGSLQTAIEKMIYQLREAGTEGLKWDEPNLICDVSIRLPEPYFDSGAEPLRIGIVIEWPLIALDDFKGKPSDASGMNGKLASALMEQGLPMWAWPFITEIGVRVELSASLNVENPKGWLLASGLPELPLRQQPILTG